LPVAEPLGRYAPATLVAEFYALPTSFSGYAASIKPIAQARNEAWIEAIRI
jgi:hypothetical protein